MTAERWLQIFAVRWNHPQVNTTERLFHRLIYSPSANDIDSAIRVSTSSRRISARSQPSGNSTPLDTSDQLYFVVRGVAGLEALPSLSNVNRFGR